MVNLLNQLKPTIELQAKTIMGPDVKISITSDGWIFVEHTSIEGGWTELTLDLWMQLVARILIDLVPPPMAEA